LYEVFTNALVNKNQIPVLLACNKSELVTSRAKEYILKVLLDELYDLMLQLCLLA